MTITFIFAIMIVAFFLQGWLGDRLLGITGMIFALAVFAEPQSEATLVNAGQTPYLARKSLALSKRVSKADLRNFVSELNDLDMQIKTNTDGDAALELYLLSLKN